MPWTPRQTRYLLSNGSPLTSPQRKKMLGELAADPSLAHARKQSHEKLRTMARTARANEPPA